MREGSEAVRAQRLLPWEEAAPGIPILRRLPLNRLGRRRAACFEAACQRILASTKRRDGLRRR